MRIAQAAAKKQLERLIEHACAGEEIIITRGKTAVARLLPVALVPVAPAKTGRAFGALRGKIKVTDAFFEPLPPEKLDRWER